MDQIYQRPVNIYQSMTVRLTSEDAFKALKDALTTDPQLNVSVDREFDYYAKQSEVLTLLIETLGSAVAAVMAVGAVFGALNTMYSAVSERGREIAAMRAMGFHSGSIVFSFMIESVIIAGFGGIVGCIAVLPLNGLTTSTLNFQTISSVAFAFRVTPLVLLAGMIFALFMGIIGGTPPAIRAARRPISSSLRGL